MLKIRPGELHYAHGLHTVRTVDLLVPSQCSSSHVFYARKENSVRMVRITRPACEITPLPRALDLDIVRWVERLHSKSHACCDC